MNKIVKPGGYLITLVYPMDEVRSDGVPVHPDQLYELLGVGWEVVLDQVPSTSRPDHVGRERMVVRRKL
jgi:methyl halide transferase